MRAETEHLIAEIEKSLALLRQRLSVRGDLALALKLHFILG